MPKHAAVDLSDLADDASKSPAAKPASASARGERQSVREPIVNVQLRLPERLHGPLVDLAHRRGMKIQGLLLETVESLLRDNA